MNQISSQQFEAIFKEAAIGIIISDSNGKIISTNKFAEKLFGYFENELIEKSISDLIPQHLKEKHHHLQNNYIQAPKSRPMGLGTDLKAKRKDGSLFSVEISLSHYSDKDKPYFIAFISDITQRRKVELELILKNNEINKLNEQLEEEVKLRTQDLEKTLKELEFKTQDLEILLTKEKELGDLKTRFVSMASHEFRTPLTAIHTTATILEKIQIQDDLKEKYIRNINRIKSSVFHLNEILEEFLSVGKIEDNKVIVHPSEIILNEFIQDIILDIESNPQFKSNIDINIEYNGIWITDFSILRKILINLITNALKFSQKPVKLHIFEENQELRFIISDNGIGISAEDQKHLFERFFRGNNTSGIQGTGLGLYLVGRYIGIIKGKIHLKSELNIGTQVDFTIPTLHL